MARRSTPSASASGFEPGDSERATSCDWYRSIRTTILPMRGKARARFSLLGERPDEGGVEMLCEHVHAAVERIAAVHEAEKTGGRKRRKIKGVGPRGTEVALVASGDAPCSQKPAIREAGVRAADAGAGGRTEGGGGPCQVIATWLWCHRGPDGLLFRDQGWSQPAARILDGTFCSGPSKHRGGHSQGGRARSECSRIGEADQGNPGAPGDTYSRFSNLLRHSVRRDAMGAPCVQEAGPVAWHRGRVDPDEEAGGMKMAKTARPRGLSFDAFLAKNLKDSEFRHHFEQRRLIHEVALAVREMREEAGLTQARLANLIGVKQPMIARVERGSDQRTPSWDVLRRVGRALGKQLVVGFVTSKRAVPLVQVDGERPGARTAG
jgi:DNA-binding XRE family transcriptional regulator